MTPSARVRSAESGSQLPVLSFSGDGPHAVSLDRLVASRMLLQANSGGGKSWALRSLLEGTHGRVQHLVIDPEGEFSSLRQRYPYLLCAAQEGDVRADPRTAGVLARRLLELGTSAVLDLYDLSVDGRREFVRRFLLELMSAPRPLWHPVLVVIDEAHDFAPEKGAGESQSTEAVVSLCTRGRKRGFAAVLATQRIAKLNKDAAAELLNKLIGRTHLDVDLKRAGDELGLDKAARQRLKQLQPGQFFAYGPALSDDIRLVRTGPVLTHHPQVGGPSSAPPPAPASLRSVVAQLMDLDRVADDEAATVADYQRQVVALKARIQQLERSGGPRSAAPVGLPEAEVRRRIATATKAVHEQVLAERKATQALAKRLAAHVAAASRALDSARASADELSQVAATAPSTESAAPSPAAAPPAAPTRGGWVVHAPPARPAHDGIVPAQQRILDTLSALEALGVTAPAKQNIAVLSGQSAKSSGFDNNLGRLRTLGLIAYPRPKSAALTDAGRAIARPKTLSSRAELHAAWEQQLSKPQWSILRALIEHYPSALSRPELAERSAQSATSSGFENNLGALRSLGVLEYLPGRLVVATSLLFPPGLS